jgi:hypothetical protein
VARYASGDALLAICRAGQGTLVFVEGESEEDDAWFYNRWFAARATEVTFVAQNGWSQVARAVATVRGLYPNRAVFGLLDGDHVAEDLDPTPPVVPPADGVLRTPRFTMENHLLDPEPLRQALASLSRTPPAGADVEARLLELYRSFAKVAAYNRAQWCLASAGCDAPFETHPAAVTNAAVSDLGVRSRARIGSDLRSVYDHAVEVLTGAPLHVLHRHVSAKYVVRALGASFPELKALGVEQRLTLLARHAPAPPDLVALVDAILAF